MLRQSNIVAMIMWLLSFFFSLLSGICFYFFKKDDAYVHQQAKESLNWGITSLLIGIVATLLGISIIAKILGVVHLIVCVMGIVACRDHRHYQVPFALRLIK